MAHPDFATAFQAGHRDCSHGNGDLWLLPARVLGTLIAPSGQIVARNPLTMLLRRAIGEGYGPPSEDTLPFSRTIPAGRYPVVGSIAVRDNDECELLAGAIIRLLDEQAVRWELATRTSHHVAMLVHDEDAAYGADETKAGCFMDAVAARQLLARFTEKIETFDEFFDGVISSLKATYRPRRAWGDIVVDPVTGANLVEEP